MPIGFPTLGFGLNGIRRKVSGDPTPPDPNLLAGLSWVAGTNTTLSTVGDYQRATAVGAANPRIYKHVTGLTNGATYRLSGIMNQGTCDGSVRARVSTTIDLPDGNIFQQIGSGPGVTINDTFVMSGTECYVGIVGVTTGSNHYSEVTTALSLVPE